jgi:hypothetical protein
VVEVKRPNTFDGKSILEDKIVLGQIYDDMLRLSCFHGLRNVFGILTTYNEWRICWLPEADVAACTESISADKTERERILEPEPDIEKEDEVEEGDVEFTEDSSAAVLG